MRAFPLAAAVLLAAASAAALLPAASAGTGCVLLAVGSCTFHCDPLDQVFVELKATKAAKIEATCGFASASCQTAAGTSTTTCAAAAQDPPLLRTTGTCTASRVQTGATIVEGACWASPPDGCNAVVTTPAVGSPPAGVDGYYVDDEGRVWRESNGLDGLQCEETCYPWLPECVPRDELVLDPRV